MIEWLKVHWFLLTALTTMSVAWGQQQIKVQSIEEAIKENVITKQKVQNIEKQSERIDERTKAMMEGQARQERLIEMMLMEQRRVKITSKNVISEDSREIKPKMTGLEKNIQKAIKEGFEVSKVGENYIMKKGDSYVGIISEKATLKSDQSFGTLSELIDELSK